MSDKVTPIRSGDASTFEGRLIEACPWCGHGTIRIDVSRRHCSTCGSMLTKKSNGPGYLVGIPAWAHTVGMILHPLRTFRTMLGGRRGPR